METLQHCIQICPPAIATSHLKDKAILKRQCAQAHMSSSVTKRDIMLEVDAISSTGFMAESKPDVDGLMQSMKQQSFQELRTNENMTHQGSILQSNEIISYDSGVILDTLIPALALNTEEDAMQREVENSNVTNTNINASFDATTPKVLYVLASLSI